MATASLIAAALLLPGCARDAAPPGSPPDAPPSAPSPEWTNETRSGDVAGPNFVVAGLDPDFLFFNVTQGTLELVVSLAAGGGDLIAYLFAPSCDSRDCAARFSTQSGATRWNATDPEAGPWEMHVAKGDPGVASVRYDVTLARRGPPA